MSSLFSCLRLFQIIQYTVQLISLLIQLILLFLTGVFVFPGQKQSLNISVAVNVK